MRKGYLAQWSGGVPGRIRTCDPWATFLSTKIRERAGLKGKEGLSEIEKKVYQFIKS